MTLLRALHVLQGGDDAGEENEAEDEELATAKFQMLKLIEAMLDKHPRSTGRRMTSSLSSWC